MSERTSASGRSSYVILLFYKLSVAQNVHGQQQQLQQQQQQY